ncbi:hypothetical protein BKA63DRAFT_30639 [Paraphoma chrysanthemicola]|nr:hypothetical protein BKA63DRAFT_30639 [Paraphoma chrysanthemicola]
MATTVGPALPPTAARISTPTPSRSPSNRPRELLTLSSLEDETPATSFTISTTRTMPQSNTTTSNTPPSLGHSKRKRERDESVEQASQLQQEERPVTAIPKQALRSSAAADPPLSRQTPRQSSRRSHKKRSTSHGIPQRLHLKVDSEDEMLPGSRLPLTLDSNDDGLKETDHRDKMFNCGICGIWLTAETVADHIEACIPAAPAPAPAPSPGIIDSTATTQKGKTKPHSFTPSELAKLATALADAGNVMPSLLARIKLSKELGVSQDRIQNYYNNALSRSQKRKAALKAAKETDVPLSTIIGIFKGAYDEKHDIFPNSRPSNETVARRFKVTEETVGHVLRL